MTVRLSAADRETLLSLAYAAVCAAVRETAPPFLDLNSLSASLREQRASFVTLLLNGKLRGCIGIVEKSHPLAEDVVLRAAAAATRDPRFSPVEHAEVDQLEIEVSVLSDPVPLVYNNPFELPTLLNVGVDGVILRHEHKKATFLPKVWERVPNPEQFLALLCRKALLPDEFWKSGELNIEIYKAHSFHR